MKANAALTNGAPAEPARSGESCPRCDCTVERIPRLGIDRLLSLIVPLRRYRCGNLACDWEGTLRAPRDGPARYGQDRRRPYL